MSKSNLTSELPRYVFVKVLNLVREPCQMVFPRAVTTLTGAREHIFKHALLHEVTYESVLKRVRRTYHAKVAEWFLARKETQQGEFVGLIAHHLERAGRTREAAIYLQQAGEQAAARYALQEAQGFFRQTLALLPETEQATRFDVYLALEEVNKWAGHRPEQASVLATLENLAQQLGEIGKQAEVALRQASYAAMISDFPTSIQRARQSITLATQIGDREKEAGGFLQCGLAQRRMGQYEPAHEALQQALALAQAAGLTALAGRCLGNIGFMALQQGKFHEAHAIFEQEYAAAQAIGNRRHEGIALQDLGVVAGELGNLSQAQGYFEQALYITRETGDRRGESVAQDNLGGVALRVGNYPQAQTHYVQALQIAREIRDPTHESAVLTNLGNVALFEEDFLVALKYFKQAFQIADAIGYQVAKGVALTGVGQALTGLKRFEEARAAFQEAIAIRQGMGATHLEMDSRAGLARVALAEGNLGEAMQHLETILAFLAQGGSLPDPISTYLVCYEVLQRHHDPRAHEILQTAYLHLQENAEKIQEEAIRLSFLKNVPWHRKLSHLYWLAFGGKDEKAGKPLMNA
jgi:tetratricopeptide (TPR) repeat protein